jgi:hypothetical protein
MAFWAGEITDKKKPVKNSSSCFFTLKESGVGFINGIRLAGLIKFSQ